LARAKVCARWTLLKTNASFHAHRFSFANTNKVLQKIRRHLAFEINWNSSLGNWNNYDFLA
jgi:hypothetical protein